MGSIIDNSHIVYVKIVIDKEEITDSNFKVNIIQKVAAHDAFEVICPTEALEGFGAYPMESSRSYLGEKILIKLIQFGEEVFAFAGIITAIKNKKFDGYEGNIIISGYSPTILLENGLDCQSYEKKSLKEIIGKATQDYPQDSVNFILKPNHTSPIAYTVQYRESDYQFIKRLAARHGEWLYYNGREIVFGRNNEGTIDLEEESEMFEYEMKMQVVPQNFTYMAYHSSAAKEVTEDSKAAQKTNYSNPFIQDAIKSSEKLFKKVPVSLYNHSLLQNGTNDLRDAVKLQKDKRANVFFVEGKSRKPELKLGAFIKLKGYLRSEKAFAGGTVPLETYRIVSLTNHHDGIDDYYNTFVAVPFEINVPDYMNDDAVPLCEEQSATVVDNHDPDGMSRIRVAFAWQKQIGEKSPWLRVTTPYAGKGKGFHVIPEIGEEVIVGFENGNAEKPFVLGAMFHGEGKSGHGNAGNFMKGFQTASGNKLQMNDQDGSVNLTDKGGANMAFDGAGNAVTNANASKTINVGKGGESVLKMDADGNISLTCNTNITLTTGKSSIIMKNDGTIIVSGKMIAVGASEDMAFAAKTSIDISSPKNHIGGGETKIDGGDVFVN